jgi:hypothetical protein
VLKPETQPAWNQSTSSRTDSTAEKPAAFFQTFFGEETNGALYARCAALIKAETSGSDQASNNVKLLLCKYPICWHIKDLAIHMVEYVCIADEMKPLLVQIVPVQFPQDIPVTGDVHRKTCTADHPLKFWYLSIRSFRHGLQSTPRFPTLLGSLKSTSTLAQSNFAGDL